MVFINEKKISVIILGSDVNAYYMARNFHEQYGIIPHLIARVPMKFTSNSKILTIEYNENLNENEVFFDLLIKRAEERKGKKIILVATNDTYLRLVIENKEELEKYYLFNYVDVDLLNNLMLKDKFSITYKNYDIDLPKTYIYNCENKKVFNLNLVNDFKFPLVLKPGNTVTYHELHFKGQAKVFIIKDSEILINAIEMIKRAGYKDKLIIQEFIPGDDTTLFDCDMYISTDKRVRLATFSQVVLQEPTISGIGNCTALINGYNEYGNTEEIVKKLVKFAENIGVQGIVEFDLKYDKRDNKFKLLEINPRQSRSGYYMTFCGYNVAKLLVDDLIYHKNINYKLCLDEKALCFVPKYIINKYVHNKKIKTEFNKLYKSKKVCNPLDYKKDNKISRRFWLTLGKLNYIKKYKNSNYK